MKKLILTILILCVAATSFAVDDISKSVKKFIGNRELVVTPEGGVAIRGKANGALSQGQLVTLTTSGEFKAMRIGSASYYDDNAGVFYLKTDLITATAVASDDIFVITKGKAKVLVDQTASIATAAMVALSVTNVGKAVTTAATDTLRLIGNALTGGASSTSIIVILK